MRSLLYHLTLWICVSGTWGLPQFSNHEQYAQGQETNQRQRQQRQPQVREKRPPPKTGIDQKTRDTYLTWGAAALAVGAGAYAKIRSKSRPHDPIKEAVDTLKAYNSPEQLQRATLLKDCFERKKQRGPHPGQSWYDFRLQSVRDCINEMHLTDDEIYETLRAFTALERILETYDQLEGKIPGVTQPETQVSGEEQQQDPRSQPPPPMPGTNPLNRGQDRPGGSKGSTTMDSRVNPGWNPARDWMSRMSQFATNTRSAINKVQGSGHDTAGPKSGLPLPGTQNFNPTLPPGKPAFMPVP